MHCDRPETLFQLTQTGALDIGSIVDERVLAHRQQEASKMEIAEASDFGIALSLERAPEAGTDFAAKRERDDATVGAHDLAAEVGVGESPGQRNRAF
jgi:hypothetical protein